MMKYNYVYNGTNGKIYTETEWVWNTTQSKYMGYRKYRYTYDSNGYLIKEETQEETSGLYLWTTFMTDTYIRDANGNLLSQTGEIISENPYYHYEYTYDSNNNLLTETDYEWNESTSDWNVNGVKYYTYDSSNNLMTLKKYDSTNNLKSTRTHYYAESNYSPIEVDSHFTYTWNIQFPSNWYTGDSIGIVTKINNNNTIPFNGSVAIQLVNKDDEDISQLLGTLDFEDDNIQPQNYKFIRVNGQIKVPAGTYSLAVLFRNSRQDDWQLAGYTEGHENPTTFVVSNRDEIKQYVILAQRSTTSNWFYLTSVNAGSEYTPHLEAVDAGTNDKHNITTSNLADKYLWQIEETISGNIYLKNGDSYISWTSGNTAFMSESGKLLTEEYSSIEGITQYYFTDSGTKRYLSLNKDTKYNYFSFYKGTQAQDLLFLEYGEQHIPTISEFIYQEDTNSNKPVKVIRNGQILIIIPNGRTYNLQGLEVSSPIGAEGK
ncbi:MAG: hypothetical protein IJ834_05115 [Paludibacteraceae bacterium]|nr:hypothetical protein [Paludibacteraceae bacterium]